MLCDHKKRTIHQISLVFIIQTRTHEQRIHSKIIICISTLSEDETFYIIVSENVYCTQIPYNVTDVAMTIMSSFYLFILTNNNKYILIDTYYLTNKLFIFYNYIKHKFNSIIKIKNYIEFILL